MKDREMAGLCLTKQSPLGDLNFKYLELEATLYYPAGPEDLELPSSLNHLE